MLDINNPEIPALIEKAIKKNKAIDLKEIKTGEFDEYPVGTVFIGKDNEERIKTIVVKDELFDWVFSLEIGHEEQKLCEICDLARFAPTGFDVKLIYKKFLTGKKRAEELQLKTGEHYHEEKGEIFYVISIKGKLIFVLTRVSDRKKVEIGLDSSKIEINGSQYSLALKIAPYINHSVTNSGETPVVLEVLADHSHDPNDDHIMKE